jgi:hypothetical protein
MVLCNLVALLCPFYRLCLNQTGLKILDPRFLKSCLFVLDAFININKLTIVGDTLPNDLQVLASLNNLSWLDIRNQAEVWPSGLYDK